MTEVNQVQGQLSQEEVTAYAGRWVAVADGKIAGVGETAIAAERLGRRNRIREKLQLVFIEEPGAEPLQRPELLDRIAPVFFGYDQPVYLVGGSVRDLLLGRTFNDLDFAVPTKAIALTFKTADYLGVPAFILDRDRDTGRAVLKDVGMTLDFAGYRGTTLDADLMDRDFTINAMALPVSAHHFSSLIDPFDGRRDLSERLIRQTHNSAIVDDPLRAMRALRLALQLGFSLEIATSTAIRHAGPFLKNVSSERIRDELLNMLSGDHPERALEALIGHSLLTYVLPEVEDTRGVEQSSPHRETVLAHSISVVAVLGQIESILIDGAKADGPAMSKIEDVLGKHHHSLKGYFSRPVQASVNGRMLLRLGAIFHDVGKPQCKSVDEDGRIRFIGHEKAGGPLAARRLQFLHLSRQVVEQVRRIVEGHLWPFHLSNERSVSRRAIYRFFKVNGASGIDIGLLSIADHLATHGGVGDKDQWTRLLKVVEDLYDHYFNHYDQTVKPVPLIDGKELMDLFDLEPGPEIGRLLKSIEEAQAAGEISSLDEAIVFAKRNLTV